MMTKWQKLACWMEEQNEYPLFHEKLRRVWQGTLAGWLRTKYPEQQVFWGCCREATRSRSHPLWSLKCRFYVKSKEIIGD